MKDQTSILKQALPISMTAVITFIVFMFAIILSSCTTEEAVLESVDTVAERIDIVFEGAEEASFYLSSDGQANTAGLVQMVRQGNSQTETEFLLHLDDHLVLVFHISDDLNPSPWTVPGQAYSLFPEAEHEDKQRYARAELRGSGELPDFVSHTAGTFPAGTYANVFRIAEYDAATERVMCRITGFPVADPSSPDQVLWINGTFRGSVAAN